MKLSKAQRELLVTIKAASANVASHYRPAVKLVEAGMATWEHGKYDNRLAITPAGLEALQSEEGTKGSASG